jgi:hypothetical protein
MIETRRAGPDDLRPASEVLGEAFADYPWTRWTVDPDDHQARITRLQLLALENLGMAFGEVWLSSDDSTVQSVAVWMDSAVPVPSSVHLAMDAVVAQLEGSRHDASLAAAREIEGWRPIQRHFTLAVLGTAPARQREGLGGRTLVPGLAAADQERAGSFLETSSVSNLPSIRPSASGSSATGVFGAADLMSGRCSASPCPTAAGLQPLNRTFHPAPATNATGDPGTARESAICAWIGDP